MKVVLHRDLLFRAIQMWGVNRTRWEQAAVYLRFPHFFWEVELPLEFGRIPKELTVELAPEYTWLATLHTDYDWIRRYFIHFVYTEYSQQKAKQ